MKSVSAVNLGSVNLKGKKEKRLRCGCCTAQDFREKELEKRHKREMNAYYSDYDCCVAVVSGNCTC